MQPIRILTQLDNPVRLLFWTLDEMALMCIPFFVGILSNSFTIIILGYFLSRKYRRYKRRYPSRRLKAIMYWHLPTRFKWIIPSHKRFFVG